MRTGVAAAAVLVGLSAAAAVLLGADGPTPGPTRTESPLSRAAGTTAAPPSPATSDRPPRAAAAVLIDGERAAADGRALGQLQSLTVKGRGPRTGYDRSVFGQRWADTDRNGCDARNDVLRRDLQSLVLDPLTGGCAVATGLLVDPYTGRTVPYERGARSDVQVDHVVALSDAWQKGAAQWSDEQREVFANDLDNLLAITGGVNAQKGDGDAATWLPPVTGIRCGYVATQVAVKADYGLAVTAAEKDAIIRVLSAC